MQMQLVKNTLQLEKWLSLLVDFSQAPLWVFAWLLTTWLIIIQYIPARMASLAYHTNSTCLVFNALRVILVRVQVLAPMVLKPRHIYTHAYRNRQLISKRQRQIFRLHVGCANTQETSSTIVPFRKDLARMNGTPQPNWKWLPALGIEPRFLDHKSQPLIIAPFLTPTQLLWWIDTTNQDNHKSKATAQSLVFYWGGGRGWIGW